MCGSPACIPPPPPPPPSAHRLFKGWRNSSQEFCPPEANTLAPRLVRTTSSVTAPWCDTVRACMHFWAVNGSSEFSTKASSPSRSINPNQAGLFWLFCGRGGVESTPPEISAVDRAITMKIGTYVTCGVIYQTIKKKKLKCSFFILY